MDKAKFESDMKVFTLKHHQSFLVYLDHLQENGWQIDDVRTYVADYKEDIRKRQKMLMEHTYEEKLCPVCQSIMFLYGVNVNKATQTEDDSKSVWICRSPECMECIYNKESVQELIAQGKGGN